MQFCAVIGERRWQKFRPSFCGFAPAGSKSFEVIPRIPSMLFSCFCSVVVFRFAIIVEIVDMFMWLWSNFVLVFIVAYAVSSFYVLIVQLFFLFLILCTREMGHSKLWIPLFHLHIKMFKSFLLWSVLISIFFSASKNQHSYLSCKSKIFFFSPKLVHLLL